MRKEKLNLEEPYLKAVKFLYAKRFDLIPHSESSFLNHLLETHSILKKWQQPQYVCLAGLFHSIYGTDIYRGTCLDWSQREIVMGLIGPRAEGLSFLFCRMDRKSLYAPQPVGEKFTLIDRFKHSAILISKNQRRDLLIVAAANLLEQCRRNHTALTPSWWKEFERRHQLPQNFLNLEPC